MVLVIRESIAKSNAKVEELKKLSAVLEINSISAKSFKFYIDRNYSTSKESRVLAQSR